MADLKLRIKFGEHEFEAEGASDLVQDQFKLFRQLVLPRPPSDVIDEPDMVLSMSKKIMRIGRKIVALSVPAAPNDAVLVLMLGQKQFRNNDAVTGLEIMGGLRDSSIHIPRADGILAKHLQNGHVEWRGSRRARRYRLTEAGVTRAQEIVRHLAR